MNQLPATSAFDPPDGPGFATIRRDNEPLFRRASRHSRRVRILRIAIPVAVVAGLLMVTLSTWLNPLRILARLPVDFGSLVISGTKITMAQPKLSGYTRDSRWYELTAQSAEQDITRPEIVELK